MLVSVDDVLKLEGYEGADPETVTRKINAIESAIRAYTNNNFIVRGARIQAPSADGVLLGSNEYITAGDRVLITRSGDYRDEGVWFVPVGLNDGLFDVTAVADGVTTLDKALYDLNLNEAYLVRYPQSIIAGVFDLLKWEAAGRDKVGVSSESISRHSVSYYQFTDSEMIMGYPAALMGFLKPYIKARF